MSDSQEQYGDDLEHGDASNVENLKHVETLDGE